MLAFGVINLEQHRALQQNTARARHPELSGLELPLIARSSRGLKLSKLNRQIPELNRRVTSRKQTTETCSNRQKIQKRSHLFSKSTGSSWAPDLDTSATRKMGLPPRENEALLQSAHTISTRFWSKSRSCRKQTTKPFLPGATTACSETAFRRIFRISAVALGDQLMLCSEVPRTSFQSSTLSRTYGRS
jgi:hypothetical protein